MPIMSIDINREDPAVDNISITTFIAVIMERNPAYLVKRDGAGHYLPTTLSGGL